MLKFTVEIKSTEANKVNVTGKFPKDISKATLEEKEVGKQVIEKFNEVLASIGSEKQD